MVGKAIESLGRAVEGLVLFQCVRIRRRKILYKSPTSDTTIGGDSIAVKVLHIKKMSIHPLHKPVEHVAGSMRTRQSEYASQIKEANSSALEKFEELIFSNIVASDEKIPSTFDGIDKIGEFVKNARG